MKRYLGLLVLILALLGAAPEMELSTAIDAPTASQMISADLAMTSPTIGEISVGAVTFSILQAAQAAPPYIEDCCAGNDGFLPQGFCCWLVGIMNDIGWE